MVDRSEAIRLAEWAEWFLRNVNDPEDFRWKHMAESATELRRLYALNQELLEVLKVIEQWNSHTVEMSIDYGSIGVRDFYRHIAGTAYCKALELIEQQEEPNV